jgi:hypothetical protein
MSQSLLSAILGFLFGIFATLALQQVWRYLLSIDPHRKEKLVHLRILKTWLESYRDLFEAVYPECPELVLAHKMLSVTYPHYDKAAPAQLYTALKQYRALAARHDELTQQAQASLATLANKRLDRLYGLNKQVSGFFQKIGLLKGALLLPVSFSTDIGNHLRIIDQYRQTVFEEFPRKAVQKIEWEKLDHLPPDQLATIVHPQLHYFQAEEDISRDREKESKLFDEMQNLSFYRIVAKREIDQILHKIRRQEEKYTFNEME